MILVFFIKLTTQKWSDKRQEQGNNNCLHWLLAPVGPVVPRTAGPANADRKQQFFLKPDRNI